MSTKKYFFMAGLPRSGSTLLSALLGQNPQMYAGPSSPVFSTMYLLENHFRVDPFFTGFPKIAQGNSIIGNIIHQYYSDVDKPVVIDKNRAWAGNIRYIEGYIKQDAKLICPVRDIDEILASFIAMIRRNPYREGNERLNIIDEQLVRNGIALNDNNRCDYIAGPQGILGQSMQAMQDGIDQGFIDRMVFVEYKRLVANPEKVLAEIYEFLGRPFFAHNFSNIENTERENDIATYGMADMHDVRKQISRADITPKNVLSQYVLDRCGKLDFWRN